MELFDNHKKLFTTAAAFFIGLTTLVAIIPAVQTDKINQPLPGAVKLSPDAQKGKAIYVANGCIACHTQQVRNLDMDKVWGKRPSVAADYALDKRPDVWHNTATLMGSERTGPDLTNIGNRQPSKDWNLVHLFNPRAVVKESVMPAYPWLFIYKEQPAKTDIVVNVPAEFMEGKTGKYVATKKAMYLLAYLQSLKQTDLPDGTTAPDFLYKQAAAKTDAAGGGAKVDGAALYTANCQSCHQASGEGLPGAFPPLKGSSVVTGDNLELYVGIIMNGYTGREKEGFGPMPNVGTTANLSPEEVTAIINHERSSWGNSAPEVKVDDVKRFMDAAKLSAGQ
ncbi:cytochrome c oxidase cbb3-type subunit 2 [Arachidicoccus rhizosphaerae]|uniref:Cytochrome c oxidase cbb3-type subunit 2 n=1 Tax=Arachidicoccus rhizosphaerae TaxID=551991 RepID=A0A1H4B8A8_9BACT|nr:cbb3-type cytochrome c oxidase subunit II [Arachidicoccus rhizosphaerae]SEA44379.1 cytochrome c oxidase cbb3-type subunit 2 [Arachidicoccus rhizosphaerae]